jgi:hypothetical protein
VTPDVVELPVSTAVGVAQVSVLVGAIMLIFGNVVLDVTATVAVEKQPFAGLFTFKV